MLEILQTLEKKHVTEKGKSLAMVLVKCLNCNTVYEIVRQNALKNNRQLRQHCKHCMLEDCHLMTNTRFWKIWQGMKWRATDTTDKNYAGRGITVCDEWVSFDNFYKDMYESYSEELTIERVDVNLPYCKSNCRWATNMEQQSNKRNNRYLTYLGQKIHLAELVRLSGFSKMMLVMRLNKGMSADEAVKDCTESGYGKSESVKNKKRREKRMSTTSLIVDQDTSS